jgi:hypothetical protein
MKKLLLFFTVFLFFAFLAAEDVKTGEYDFGDITVTLFEEREAVPEPEPEPEPEKEPEPKPAEPAPETAEMADLNKSLRENHVKPKFFYIQPLGGVEISEMYFSFIVALDSYFLLNHNADSAVNVYLGTEIGFKYTPVIDSLADDMEAHLFEFPIQALFVIDAQVSPQYSTRLGGWVSLGPDLVLEKFEGTDSVDYNYITWFMCGFGLNVSFGDLVIKLGTSGSMRNFDFIALAGYRF